MKLSATVKEAVADAEVHDSKKKPPKYVLALFDLAPYPSLARAPRAAQPNPLKLRISSV